MSLSAGMTEFERSDPEFAERFVENAKKFSKSGKDML